MRPLTILFIAIGCLTFLSHRLFAISAEPRHVLRASRHQSSLGRFAGHADEEAVAVNEEVAGIVGRETYPSEALDDTADPAGEQINGDEDIEEEGLADADAPEHDSTLGMPAPVANEDALAVHKGTSSAIADTRGAATPSAILAAASLSRKAYPTEATEFECLPPKQTRPTRPLDYIVSSLPRAVAAL